MPVLFFAFWIILNGRLTVEIAIFGVAISLVVYLFCHKYLGYEIPKELRLYRRLLRMLGYVFLVLWEIAKANFGVLKVLYRFKRKPEPVLVQFRTDLKTNAARIALANSITLTPGTITVLQEEDRFTVHCLDKSFADDLEDSSFVRYLRKTEALTMEEPSRRKRKGAVR